MNQEAVAANLHDTLVAGQTGLVVPLVISVTGHRDLVPQETAEIRDRVREFLQFVRDEYPERGISVMSSLAEGADQLVASEALALDLPLIAALPMPRECYEGDFCGAPLDEFHRLCAAATELFELPLVDGVSVERLASDDHARAVQYAQMGVFLCSHCQILLALWDGKYNDALGGTGQVVRFHHDDIMPGLTGGNASRLILTDDESDLVYHIVCSRERPDGAPAANLQPLSSAWFTTDEEAPRSGEMPVRHRRVFGHTGEFSRDIAEHVSDIEAGSWPLLEEPAKAGLPHGLADIDHIFRGADWLAMHYQKRRGFALQTTHALALLMGLMYILYSDYAPDRIYMLGFGVFFVAVLVLNQISDRYEWHRKYLDYRALAEGLRVQFYWAAAGVVSGGASKYAHDNFLQMQDGDLGWIRNVMRVAGMEANVAPNLHPSGVEFVLREWIGDENAGQLGYYRRKGKEKIKRHKITEGYARAVLWVSAAAFSLFIVATDDVADVLRDPMVIFMGVMLLVFGLRRSYSFSVANTELIKQYEFMDRAFSRAKKRLDACSSDEERRDVLRLLGDAALEEHAGWIMMHRERAPDEGGLWKVKRHGKSSRRA